MANCAIREAAFREVLPTTREHITRADDKVHFHPALQ
jgi:hypothetical protein